MEYKLLQNIRCKMTQCNVRFIVYFLVRKWLIKNLFDAKLCNVWWLLCILIDVIKGKMIWWKITRCKITRFKVSRCMITSCKIIYKILQDTKYFSTS